MSNTDTTVSASCHLRNDTWPKRGDPSIDPIVVWDRSDELDVSILPYADRQIPDHDEARWDARTQTVIFRRNDVLTTVYNVTDEHVDTLAGLAVRQVVAKQFGISALRDRSDSITTDSG